MKVTTLKPSQQSKTDGTLQSSNHKPLFVSFARNFVIDVCMNLNIFHLGVS
jgi:hypothetical protein